ncbi:MAG: DNA methyltransferase [Planctomycetota bacterium]|jgi:site-specific DNA-methyltransferase (adenine-specific)
MDRQNTCASQEIAEAYRIELAIGEHFNVLNNIRWYKEAGWHQKTDKEAIRSYLSPWEAIIFAEQWFSDGAYQDRFSHTWSNGFLLLRDYFKCYQDAIGLKIGEINRILGHRKAEHAFYWNSTQWDLPTKEVYQELGETFNTNGFLRREYEDLRREYEDLRREYEDLRRPFNGNKDTPHTDLWTFSPVSDYPGKHPTEKPIALMEHIIKISTRPGDIILDFCMGNGTTLKAAQNLGRKAVGIDITEMYCRRTVERLRPRRRLSNWPLLGRK